MWGIVTQFLYVAAQVGVNAFSVNYILENAITKDAAGATVTDKLFAWYGNLTGAASPEATAAYVITIAMILYATGRFTGAAIASVMLTSIGFNVHGAILNNVSAPTGRYGYYYYRDYNYGKSYYVQPAPTPTPES